MSYDALKSRLARGWNTWNTRSVLSHVLLPAGFALNLGIKEYAGSGYLREALIGRRGADVEHIHPGLRSYDGAYSDLNLAWRGVEVRIQTASDADGLVVLATPLRRQHRAADLVVEPAVLWNRPGSVERRPDGLAFRTPGGTVLPIRASTAAAQDPYVPATGPYLSLPLHDSVAITVGPSRSMDDIEALLNSRHTEQQARVDRYGALSPLYHAIQTCLAWDTIYEPLGERVVTPVSRIWNCGWGGYVLFCWDTYFAAYLAALDNRDLAYANAIEITSEITEQGFVPNFATVHDVKSRDRSQPPVGSLTVLALYRQFGDRWLLEEVFDRLLEWNRWWSRTRAGSDALLAWGSNPYEPKVRAYFEVTDVDNLAGAMFESGLDNSPMYDGVPFDHASHLMQLADAGLNGLFVADTDALTAIAQELGRPEQTELAQRAQTYRRRIGELWDDASGIFLNRRADTGGFSHCLSPTLFYPLLGRAATQSQAERMVAEHLWNPKEFWGHWMMPSVARSDPAYPDQNYWRGRIWAPMNFLVYLGLRLYGLREAERSLVEKSAALLMKEWRAKGHVHENYSAETGDGCDVDSSDAFYSWGALLGLMSFIEAGHVPAPFDPPTAQEGRTP